VTAIILVKQKGSGQGDNRSSAWQDRFTNMKNGIFCRVRKERCPESVAFAILGLVGFLTVSVALLASSDFVRQKERVIARLMGNSSKDTARWKADCRTLGAMIHYVFEAEPDLPGIAGAQNISTVAPVQLKSTNSASISSPPLG
jgi:hypothetical protein